MIWIGIGIGLAIGVVIGIVMGIVLIGMVFDQASLRGRR